MTGRNTLCMIHVPWGSNHTFLAYSCTHLEHGGGRGGLFHAPSRLFIRCAKCSCAIYLATTKCSYSCRPWVLGCAYHLPRATRRCPPGISTKRPRVRAIPSDFRGQLSLLYHIDWQYTYPTEPMDIADLKWLQIDWSLAASRTGACLYNKT